MSTTDELNLLIQNLQKCNNANECINFDLASTIQGFLNCLDKNVLENIDKGIGENEYEKEVVDSFTSAAIFVENCVKIFSQKIEHLHNLAHNTLYNIYKENKHNSSSKKNQLIISDEEEYLYINEIKNMKNIQHENDTIEDDILIKSIPFPTFLFSDNIKKTKDINEDKRKTDLNKNNEDKEKDNKNKDNDIDSINEFEITENNSVNTLNFEKIYLENDGILLLDINDYNIFIDDPYNYSIENKNSTILFEKYDFFSRHSTYLSSNTLSKYVVENKNMDHIYKLYNHITDIINKNICFDIFLFKQDFFDYDFSLGILKNKKAILKKFKQQQKKLHLLEENKHMENHINNNYHLYKCDLNRPLPHYYMLHCYNIKNFQDFFRYMQPNYILEIIKRDIIKQIYKTNQQQTEILNEPYAINNEQKNNNNTSDTIDKKNNDHKDNNMDHPHYEDNTKYYANPFYDYNILDNIFQFDHMINYDPYFYYKNLNLHHNVNINNLDKNTNKNQTNDDKNIINNLYANDIKETEKNVLMSSNINNFSNDQKLFNQIKIPELYIQKLGLNFSYYHLEPLIYNFIKTLKKKNDIEKFFSVNLFDDKPIYEFDILRDDEYDEQINDDNKNYMDQNNNFDNFTEKNILNDEMNNIPIGIFENDHLENTFNMNEDQELQDRVSKWNAFIEEKLEILKRQPKYDVDLYKKNIINYTINNGDNISFTKLIKNKDKFEISRNFLTTLMLINTDILNIKKINKHKKSNNVSNYEIHIKKENLQQYLTISKKVQNKAILITEKKRKTNKGHLTNGMNDSLKKKQKI
ncbi:conserved Plasmodium protein, unknown function [Plasmodium sp. gorilla clade G2]|uniref:conserved Plasmodium protein, unknown function n=1 Tax=Plasmodium sp. gorilla clade G2 TaxID=880535 RepID=UPI000D21E0BF|nr:conserved Plasmodium protein, unknown function [Plasmodium sp. gorilla clade G2]SOV10492.1 conserved Plasmodium protein, unknown function [Plasmodium sp. gorilla clade G2]